MKRVVIVGSTGQLGTELVARLERAGTYAVTPLSHQDLECTDAGAVERTLQTLRPDIVINAAAYVRVDEAEDRPDDAFRSNAYGALYIARVCADIGALCVYISTDYVFSGDAGRPYLEHDTPGPINVYGASKLAGEHLTRQAATRWMIVRLASLFGARGKRGNFVETVLQRSRGGQTLRVVDDIYMSPTYAADAAAVVERLLGNRTTEILHVTNHGACTWYEFARQALDLTDAGGRIEPVRSAEYPTKARRPGNSSLASGRLAAELGEELRPWQDALRAYLVERGHVR